MYFDFRILYTKSPLFGDLFLHFVWLTNEMDEKKMVTRENAVILYLYSRRENGNCDVNGGLNQTLAI